ncbi:MAG TPA: hypothetical protein DDW52_00990, partial [Planctomycetaceae bacterium]|nr:hypothetical protein [Planctomycetaceae bacterium]
MSKLTRIWKHHIRKRLVSVRETLASPEEQITAVDAVKASKSAFFVGHSDSESANPQIRHEALPPRVISDPSGHLTTFQIQNEHFWAEGIGLNFHRETESDEFTDFCLSTPGSAVGTDGALITSDGALLSDVSGTWLGNVDSLDPLSAGRLPKPSQLHRPLAIMTGWKSDNYYHWLVDCLAAYRLVEPACDDQTLFYAPLRKRYQAESLAALGIPTDRVVPATYYTHVASPALMCAASQSHKVSQRDVQFLYERLAAPLNCEPKRRIFLSRKRRGRRRLINERQVLAALRPLGFEPVLLERLSFQEQVQLFASSECIVGPHGAGLANIAFAHASAKVLEITTPYRLYGYHCFWQIAAGRELDYRALV